MRVRSWMGKAAVAALLATAVFGVSGMAIALDGQTRPRTDDVTLQFLGTENVDRRTEHLCDGEDGLYRRLKQVYTGEATGGTDRDLMNLTGPFEAVVHTFYNTQTFDGTTEGTYSIRDASTGKLKFLGKFIGATHSSGVEGVITGHIHDIDPATPDSAGMLVGTFRVGVVPDFPGQRRPFIVEGDIGGNDELPANEPAVVVAGNCGPSAEG
jgi:hypothetical protein